MEEETSLSEGTASDVGATGAGDRLAVKVRKTIIHMKKIVFWKRDRIKPSLEKDKRDTCALLVERDQKRDRYSRCHLAENMCLSISQVYQKNGDPQEKNGDTASTNSSVTLRVPRRVLHFSDGTMEEYETDEEEADANVPPANMQVVDPRTLSWGPWVWHYMLRTGSIALHTCDYAGEKLAHAFGITSPKYQYEIDEYRRAAAAEERRRRERKLQTSGWSASGEGTGVEAQPVILKVPVGEPPERV